MRYYSVMTDTKLRAMPSPLPPTEAELEAWNALTRDEQIARYREYLSHPDCERVSSATMADVLAEARERVAHRRRG
jgi:hypothetical protein